MHKHTALGALAMCGMSHRGGLIFSVWEITLNYSQFAPVFLQEKGQKKTATLREFFSGTFSKRRQLVAAGIAMQRCPFPKYAGNIHSEPVANFQQKTHSQHQTVFLGQRSQKLKQSQWIILDAKNTN